jgi:hypothetical protein
MADLPPLIPARDDATIGRWLYRQLVQREMDRLTRQAA